MDPEKGATGHTIFTISEIWNATEDIQADIERASKVSNFERFLTANLEYSTMSITCR